MPRRLIALLTLALASLAPAATAGAAEAPTNVKLTSYEQTTISWDGAPGVQWQVVLIGKRGTETLALTSKRKLMLGWARVGGVADWGQTITAYVAQCDTPGEGFAATLKNVFVYCDPAALSPWGASPTVVHMGPPDVQLVDGPTDRLTWRVRAGKEFAPVTGYTVRWRPDFTKNPWKTTKLPAGAKSFRVPGSKSGSYWDIKITPHSVAGNGDVLNVGFYVS